MVFLVLGSLKILLGTASFCFAIAAFSFSTATLLFSSGEISSFSGSISYTADSSSLKAALRSSRALRLFPGTGKGASTSGAKAVPSSDAWIVPHRDYGYSSIVTMGLVDGAFFWAMLILDLSDSAILL